MFVDAIYQKIGDEPIKAVVVRDAVGDPQRDGLLMRVKSVAAAIHHLDALDSDVAVLARVLRPHARIGAIDLLRDFSAVAVDGQVVQAGILRGLVERGPHHAGVS